MRRLRLVLSAIVLVLLLLVVAAAFGPAILDWNRYRDSIAALAAQQIGRPVHIGGAVSLALLPQPVLTAGDIAVEDAGDGVVLSARALRLRVALGGLLGGKVDARELVLQGADLHLPWPLPAGAWARRPPAWLTGLRARVEDGRLSLGALVFTGVAARVETDPETGSLSAAGTAQSGGRGWQFTARLGRPGGDGAASLEMSLDGQGALRDTGAGFTGVLAAGGALNGRVVGRGPDLSLLMPAPSLPWRGEGRLSAQGGLAVADELALEIGGAPARGAVALRVGPEPRLDLALATGRLDLDAWLPALVRDGRPGLRAGLPTGIDLSAEAASLSGGLLRDLRAAIDLGGGAVRVREVSALLPGEGRLTLGGQVAGSPARFEGSGRVTLPDLRTTLQWLSGPLPWIGRLNQAVLRSADLTGAVSADLSQVAVSGLRGRLDGAQVSGSLSLQAPPPAAPAPAGTAPPAAAPAAAGVRAKLALDLAVDRLDLDPWLPATPPDPAALLSALRTLDADLRLQAAAARWGGVGLGPLRIELQTDASRVALRRLEAQPLGGRLLLAGQVGEGGRLADGRIDLAAPDLGMLRQVTPLWERTPPWLQRLLQGPGSLLAQAAGPPDAIAGRLQAEIGDLRLDVQPSVNLGLRSLSGTIALHHPGATRLLSQAGVAGTEAWLGEGSLSLLGRLSLAPGRAAIENASFGAGALRATGRLGLEGRALSGQIVAETLPLPAPDPHSPDPLPLGWTQGGWQAALRLEAGQVLLGQVPALQGLAADLRLERGVLALSGLSARLAGGSLSGAASLDAARTPPRLAIAGRAEGLRLAGPLLGTPLDLVAGRLDLGADLTAEGYGMAALLATLGGQMRLHASDGVASGFDLEGAVAAAKLTEAAEAMEAARRALLGGTTPFATLDLPVRVAAGLAQFDGALAPAPPAPAAAPGAEPAAAPAAAARLTGSADLASGALDLRLSLDAGPASIAVRIGGPLDRPVRTPELAGLARALAERPASPAQPLAPAAPSSLTPPAPSPPSPSPPSLSPPSPSPPHH